LTQLTPKKREQYLAHLADGQSVTAASKAIGMTRQAMYARRKLEPDFAADWEDAVEAGTDGLEDEAIRRAKTGSDTMLIFMLKGRRPEKFKERVSTELSGKLEVSHEEWLKRLS
jgi:hypothetical protein